MFNVLMPHDYLMNGYYVAELSTGEVIASKSLKVVYTSCLMNLKDACYLYRKYAHGSNYYSAVIHTPSGFKYEVTVYDMPFYKGVAIERNSKTYYCNEVK